MSNATMRAVVLDRFGNQGVMRLGEIGRPQAGPGEAVVRASSSVHS